MKKNIPNKLFKIVVSLICFVILALFIMFFWLASGTLTQNKAALLKIIPFPLVIVNGSPIFANEYLFRVKIASQNPELVNTSHAETKQAILNQLIYEKTIAILAAKNNVEVNKKELGNAFAYRSMQTGNNESKTFLQNLNKLGFNEAEYKQTVLTPEIEKNNLTTWFYSQKNLNLKAYSTVEAIQIKIAANEDFSTLTQEYTQDSTGKQTQGDIGYVEIPNLLPELQETADSMSTGEIKVAASRYGINILKMEDKDNNGPDGASRVHLRVILISGEDFAAWLNAQTNFFKIKQLVAL